MDRDIGPFEVFLQKGGGEHMNNNQIQFEELDEMEAPSWESFYQGVLIGIGLVAIVAT